MRVPARLLLGYFLLVIGLIVLAPFHFVWPAGVRLSWLVKPGDVVANVLLFVPLGFVYRLGRAPATRAPAARAAAVGAAVSAGLEAVQLLLPGRFPSPVDVASNGLGAGIGALTLGLLEGRLDARRLRPLALDLPLMNLVYLLLPLLWLDGLAAGRDPARLLLGSLLGLAGAVVVGAIGRHRLAGAPAGPGPAGLGFGAGAWYLVGAAPGLLRWPALALGTAAVVTAAAWLEAARPAPGRPERRFEVPTLRRVWPVLGAYLVASALWPLPWSPGPWRGAWALLDLGETPGVVPVLRDVELLAGFTVLGYTVAEARGRRPEPRRRLVGWLVAVCLGGAALLEALRGFHPAHGASGLGVVLATVAGLYGGLLYRAHLAVVRRLLLSGGAAGGR